MKKRAINITSGAFFIIGGALLILSFIEYREYQQKEKSRVELRQSEIAVLTFNVDTALNDLHPATPKKEIYNNLNRDSLSHIALFILHPTVCYSCITEVHEFIEVFNSLKQVEIQPVIVANESDSSSALGFLKIAKFEAPAFWGTSYQLKKITHMINDRPPIKQLIAFCRYF